MNVVFLYQSGRQMDALGRTVAVEKVNLSLSSCLSPVEAVMTTVKFQLVLAVRGG